MCAQESDRFSVTVNKSSDSFENNISDNSVNYADSAKELCDRDEYNISTV